MGTLHAELFDFLVSRYTLDELKTLCLNLGVAYDRLEGTTRDSLARELILYLERNNRLEELQRLKRNQGKPKYPKYKARRHSNRNHNPNQVFISYAQRNAKWANKLANDLRSKGYKVWIAPQSISPGEDWEDAIENGLLESGVFLLVMTASAAESYWVQEETKVAFRLEKTGSMRVIPLDVSEAPSLPVWWTNRQHISFRNYSRGLAKLLDVLDEHSKRSESFAPVAASPHAEVQVQAEVQVDAEAAGEHLSALLVSSDTIGFDEPGGEGIKDAEERVVTSAVDSSLPHTSANIGLSNIRVWGWVIGLVVIGALVVWATSLLRGSNNGSELNDGTPITTKAVVEVAENIGPTQAVEQTAENVSPALRPTATIVSIPTAVPTLIPIQSWASESDFSVAQGWDILVDANGESGFEDGRFFLTNKKENLLYISLWDALGGIINNAVFSVDLIDPGKSEAPNAAGLVFGWGPDSEDPTFAFLVTKDGGCEFRQESNNRWTRVSQGQLSNFNQQKESHKVSVVIRDGHAYGFVDGLYCDDNVFPLYESGYIGVAALSGIDQEDGSKGYFDNARFANLP